jgi:DNA-binding MarR family transcriptional regulator
MATVRAAEPVGQARLAALLETDQTTLSRNLKLLLARGWVEMASDDRDGRRRRYRLSGPGTVALRDAKACWDVVHREMEGLLGGSMEDLWPVLDRIQDAARVD